MKKMSFLFTTLLLCQITNAEIIQLKDHTSQVGVAKLKSNQVALFSKVYSPAEFKKDFGKYKKLDSLKFSQSKQPLLVIKSINVIKKPVGFFDSKQFARLDFMQALYPGLKVEKDSDSLFVMKDPVTNQKYVELYQYYDSDDMTDLPHEASLGAVASLKDKDTITLSSFMTLYREFKLPQERQLQSFSLSSFMSYTQDRTIVVSYYFFQSKAGALKPQALQKDLEDEILNQEKIIETYRDPHSL